MSGACTNLGFLLFTVSFRPSHLFVSFVLGCFFNRVSFKLDLLASGGFFSSDIVDSHTGVCD